MGGGVSTSSFPDIVQLIKSQTDIAVTVKKIQKTLQAIDDEKMPVPEGVELLSQSLGLVDWIEFILQSRKSTDIEHIKRLLVSLIFSAVWNNNRNPQAHFLNYFCSPDARILKTMSTLVAKMDYDDYTYGWVLCVIAKHCKANNAADIIQSGIHLEVIEMLNKFTNNIPRYWPQSMEGSMEFLMYISRHSTTTAVLKESNLIPVLHIILTHANAGSNSIKALLALMFLSGKDEKASESAQFMKLKPNAIECLLKVFESIVNVQDGDGYTFGVFSLKLIVQACLYLATSDSKKGLLMRTNILTLLYAALELFITDAEPLKVSVRIVPTLF